MAIAHKPNLTIDLELLEQENEWARRRKITEAILSNSMGFDFEFEQRPLTKVCLGHVGNGFKNEEPTGEIEYVIRLKYSPHRSKQ